MSKDKFSELLSSIEEALKLENQNSNDGSQSPLTYGDSLEEGPFDQEENFGNDEVQSMIDQISYMQDMGLSKSDQFYSEDELYAMPEEEVKNIYSQVMGQLGEANKPTKIKTDLDDFDDLDDVLNPKKPDLPSTIDADPDQEPEGIDLPTASRSRTQSKLSGMTPTDTMRDYINRINFGAINAEPDLPDQEIVVRTAQDVPAVISNAMITTGMQSPEWHTIDNLPGYRERHIRTIGRQMFSMFTRTPMEQIKTIANVGGQGPNTDAEIRAVAGWLKNNAEDLGKTDLDFGPIIPGYKPDVKEYRIKGVRFQVVRDPMGQYIYAYPESDARLNGGQDQDQNRLGRGNMPRLREDELLVDKPTLFEQIKWDEELKQLLAENVLEESTLSRLIGRHKGGQKLVRWLHRNHKLSNEADLQPAPFSKRLLWKEYKRNPDNFVIVSAENGVAGIKPYEKHIKDKTQAARLKNKSYDPGGDSTLPYQIMAFKDDGEQVDPSLLQPKARDDDEERYADPTVMKARMGLHTGKEMQNPDNVFNLLANEIGRLKIVWVTGAGASGDTDDMVPFQKGAVEREKMQKRADIKTPKTMSTHAAIKRIFDRVRPVLPAIANQRLSLLQRSAQRAMQGGNFEQAEKLMTTAKKLQDYLHLLDTEKDIDLVKNQDFERTIEKALIKASGAERFSSKFTEWLNAAANGNSIALKPVLDALRDQFVDKLGQ